MIKRLTQPMMAICILGLFLSTATAQSDLKIGDKAPDFEIETLAGTKFKLSERFGENGEPTILLFSRANW